MARRSQCSSAGDNPNHPNYLPPHYREEYRLAIDALVEDDLEGYYQFLQKADVVDFLCTPEIQNIQNSIHLPRQSSHPEQHFLEIGEDGSSDTYWPLHSDLDVPGLDLGWPQMHHFLGPTEVTTLVNPPEPGMPSIKDQARRLIKNAQQVIAIAMDMFTDVDMFADILNAAMRNVAVYIILDEQNAHYFVDMVSNCRVNLQSIQFLRVRTVPGITYQCRSGKSFKGQMMDRFLLTDCRAVLSGNYSFMWSYEKLHRCMAHLFLGQLVTTFDEEFRILYAQSQPLIVEMSGPMEGIGHPQQRQYPSERQPLYREPKKFLDPRPPDEWIRPAYDEPDRMMMPLKKDQARGPPDLYNRFPFQQSRIEPPFDHGSSRTPMMENPAFKRHSYAEGVPGRYNTQFLQQQGMPDSEAHSKRFGKGQQPHPGPGQEADYSAYDKFWNQDYLSTDLYPEPGPPLDDVPGDFDPVLNYLSSTETADLDQVSDKLLSADSPFGSPHPRRHTSGQPYACQTSPTPSNPSEQKRFLQDLTSDRKDPAVKRGLRNWRISSYLSAYDNPGEEGLPMAPPQASDPFEEPSNPIQQPASRVDMSLTKIPNVREFKVPAVPRASQMPSYLKAITKEQPKQGVEEPAAMTDTKTTPTPSDSSSTTEGEKVEEVSALRREDSFRRKYNAAQPRSSRLRSSLIFSSLDQQNTLDTKSDQQDEESDKNEPEQTKLPILSQLLGQRRSSAREPIEWSRFMKSATFDHSSTETSKPGGDNDADEKDNKLNEDDNSKDLSQKPQESLKESNAEQTKSSEAALQPPLVSPPTYVDMSDPDNRLMYFKQLAAKRKAAKAAEAERNKGKSSLEPPADVKKEEHVENESRGNETSTAELSSEKCVAAQSALEVVSTVDKENLVPEESSENMASEAKALLEKHATAESDLKAVSTEAHKSDCPSPDATGTMVDRGNCVQNASSDATSSIKAQESKVISDSNISKLDNSSAQVLAEKESSYLKSKSNSAGKDNKPDLSSATTDSPHVATLAKGTDKSKEPSIDSTLKECLSVETSSVGELESPVLDSNPLDKNVSSSPLLAKPDTGSQVSSSNLSMDIPAPDKNSSRLSNQTESGSSNVTPKVSISTPAYSIFLSNVSTKTTEESASSFSEEPAQSGVKNSNETLTPQAPLDSSLPETSSETSSELDSAQAISRDVPPASEPDRYSSWPTTGPEPEEVSRNATSPKESQKGIHYAKDEACKSETAIPEVNKVDSDLHKNISAPVRSGLKSDQDVSESDNVDSAAKGVASVSNNKSEKDTCLSGSIVPQTEGVSASEEVASQLVSDASDLGISSPPHSVADDSVSCGSNIKVDSVSYGVRSVPDSSSLPMQSPVSKTDLKETSTLTSTPELTPTSAQTDGAETTQSPLEAANQATQPSDLKAESDLSSEVKAAETNMPALKSVCHASETQAHSTKASQPPSANSPSSPTESTLTEATEINPPGSTHESEASKSHTSKPTVTSEHGTTEMVTDEQKSSDTKNSNIIQEDDQVKTIVCPDPAEVTAKQPKSTQSRYHSSTANVLSSSNLRDDTKLLLEQISANSQTRSDTAKESPVTDDEKEDEADKIAKIQKERGIRSLNKGQDKSAPEREKLLERFQSIRKERKVYSRFEV